MFHCKRVHPRGTSFTGATLFQQGFLTPANASTCRWKGLCSYSHTVKSSSPMLKPFWHYTAETLAPRQRRYHTQKQKIENRFPPLRQAEELQPYTEGVQWGAFYYTCTPQHETKKVGLPISRPIVHSAWSCGVFFLPPEWLRVQTKQFTVTTTSCNHEHTPCL